MSVSILMIAVYFVVSLYISYRMADDIKVNTRTHTRASSGALRRLPATQDAPYETNYANLRRSEVHLTHPYHDDHHHGNLHPFGNPHCHGVP